MDIRTIVTKGSAAGVVRLILLTFAAAGFVAMHGVAATDPVAGHLSPMDMPLTTAHPAPSTAAVLHATAPTPTHGAMAAVTVSAEPVPAGGSHDHDEMAACVFVLLTVLACVTLQALKGRLGGAPPVPAAAVREGRGPPRAPPRPVFLSLCVFRL